MELIRDDDARQDEAAQGDQTGDAVKAVLATSEQLLEAGLFRPDRLVEPDPWIGHIPFAFWLMAAHRPALLVELGTHTGNSYAAFCQAVAQLRLHTACYAVDTWQGDPQAGFYGEDVFAELSSYHDRRYATFSRLIRSTFDEALEHFADGSIDLLHIDGYHTYEAVRHDFEAWRPKLSARAIVLLHDVNVRERDFGAWRLWDELRSVHPHFTFLHHHGLGVLCVGTQQTPAVRELLGASAAPGPGAAVRYWFANAARGVQTELELQRSAAERARLGSELGAALGHREQVEAVLAAAVQHRDEIEGALEREREAWASEREAWASERGDLVGEHERLSGELARVGDDLRASRGDADGLRRTLAAAEDRERAALHQLAKSQRQQKKMRRSLSWRLTRPVRLAASRAKRWVGGRRRPPDDTSGNSPPHHEPGTWRFDGDDHPSESFATRLRDLNPLLQPYQGPNSPSRATQVRCAEPAFKDGRRNPDAVAVIVPTLNRAEYIIPLTRQLESAVTELRDKGLPLSVVIGDTGSTDAAVLSRYDDLPAAFTVVYNCEYHFSKLNNFLVQFAGDAGILFFLNNDISFSDPAGSILRLRNELANSDEIAAVGARLLFPDGRLQHDGIDAFREGPNTGFVHHPGSGGAPPDLRERSRACLAATGACLMVRRSAFETVLGFDPGYHKECQDVALCLALQRLGYGIRVVDSGRIVHFENGTRPRGEESWEDRQRFMRQWGTWVDHCWLKTPPQER
jgi:GT2 family glycosyltransferase